MELKVLLFYKYVRLSGVDATADALRELCSSLRITGRVLLSANEGVNGTLSATQQNIEAFLEAVRGGSFPLLVDITFKESVEPASEGQLFPDLKVAVVNEIINTGGVLSAIPIEKTGVGYLNPQQFHQEVEKLAAGGGEEETVLIDCRNHKEYAIGQSANVLFFFADSSEHADGQTLWTRADPKQPNSACRRELPDATTSDPSGMLRDAGTRETATALCPFSGAVDPATRTFSEFPRWVLYAITNVP